MPTISEQANKAAIEAVRSDKPSSFTVGGVLTADGRVSGGVTYDRKLSNAFGLTAYVRAYWNDLPVVVHSPAPKIEAGFELSKKF